MAIEIYPSVAKVKRNGVFQNLPGFVQQSGDADIEAIIARKEISPNATFVHPKGSYFILNDVLYKATDDIPVNGAISVGDNCEIAILANDVYDNTNGISDLKNSLANLNSYDVLYSLQHLSNTVNGVTYVWDAENKTCTANGTATNPFSYNTFYLNKLVMPFGMIAGETYNIKYSTSDPNLKLQILTYRDDGNATSNTSFSADGTFTVPNDCTGFTIRLFIESGITVNNAVVSDCRIINAPSNKDIYNLFAKTIMRGSETTVTTGSINDDKYRMSGFWYMNDGVLNKPENFGTLITIHSIANASTGSTVQMFNGTSGKFYYRYITAGNWNNVSSIAWNEIATNLNQNTLIKRGSEATVSTGSINDSDYLMSGFWYMNNGVTDKPTNFGTLVSIHSITNNDTGSTNQIFFSTSGLIYTRYITASKWNDVPSVEWEEYTINIVTLNAEENVYARQSATMHSSTFIGRNFSILFFSDIHRSLFNWLRIVDYIDNFNDIIDYAVCGGDYVSNYQAEYTDLYAAKTATRPILMCVGNHDTYTDATNRQINPDKSVVYNLLFNHTSDWNVTWGTGESYPMYYYKDSEYGVRLIVLDQYYISTAQRTWLETVLQDAITNNIPVITVSHTPTEEITTFIGPFNANYGLAPDEKTDVNGFEDIIHDFVTNGGTHIVHLCGHWHHDIMGTTDNGILNCDIGQAAVSTSLSGRNNSNRSRKDKSADLFNIIGVDTNEHLLKIVRIGTNMDYQMHKKSFVSINYLTKTVVEEG